MRSHAKALSAGSNSYQGGSRGSLRRPGALSALLLALAVAACLLPGSAFAIETRPPVESFGPDGTSGTSFATPEALSFDQGEKRLYAFDGGSSEIFGFDASSAGTHTPLGGEFPLGVEAGGEVPDLAVDSSSHDLYYDSTETNSLYAFDSTGAEIAGNFPLGGFEFPCGAAVDPSGNVWVSTLYAQAVKEFDSAGNPLGSVDVSAHGYPCHIAFDADANLYVALYEGEVWRYSAASGYTEATLVDAALGTPTNAIAVDRSSGDLYVAHRSRISVYDPSGALLYEFGETVSGAIYTGIAVNQATDQVYVSDRGNGVVQVFGPLALLPDIVTEDATAVTDSEATLHAKVKPNGKQLTDCHFEYVTEAAFQSTGFSDLSSGGSAPCVPAAASIPADTGSHSVSAEISGLTPGNTYRFRLIAGTSEGSAEGPQRILTTASGAPSVGAQSVEAVGTSDAILSAKINPKGAKATYHVEYGTSASYGQGTAESAPIGFEGDESEHTVSVHIGGLTAGTAYHFRFVATNSVGGTEGTDTTFATYPTIPTLGACPNDQFRTGFGAQLSDCRAYEQATPADKHGANVQGTINAVQASSAGNRVTFYLNGGLPTSGGSSTLSAFVASRGAAGWSSDSLLPPTEEPGAEAFDLGWSEDLATTAVTAPGPGNVGEAVYLRDSDSGALQLGVVNSGGEKALAGFAADTSHLIFESNSKLLPDAAPGRDNLYDLDHGALTLVGRIPAGSATSCDDTSGPACVPAPEGSFAGPYNWFSGFQSNTRGGALNSYYTLNTISRDGSKVFFTIPGSAQLYVRENGTATTQVSASQAAVADPNGHKPAAFMAATPDGSKVFFTSCEKLTDDSTAFSTGENACNEYAVGENFQGQDLYSYDTRTGDLTDLTVDSNAGDPRGAEVQGVLGASEDGSYVYFVANGVLAPGASPGRCKIEVAFRGPCNLYVSHAGTTAFVASLSGPDVDPQSVEQDNWRPTNRGGNAEPKVSRVSADGRSVLFSSHRSLTGYNNVPTNPVPECGGSHSGINYPCSEFYRYSATDEKLTCVSCDPTGVPPSGNAALGSPRTFLINPPKTTFLTRNLSADGNKVFFESPDALLPTDTNGVKDVYEWEAKGSGSCESESQDGGCLYLISSGTSPNPSWFADASANGDHAFFFTDQQLVPGDKDDLYDVYDAGVGVGLAAQHVLAPPTCTGVACQANAAPPPDQPASSAVFSGPGNAKKPPAARRCPKGKRKVRRAGKVHCQKAHKQHKRHSNRGGSK